MPLTGFVERSGGAWWPTWLLSLSSMSVGAEEENCVAVKRLSRAPSKYQPGPNIQRNECCIKLQVMAISCAFAVSVVVRFILSKDIVPLTLWGSGV